MCEAVFAYLPQDRIADLVYKMLMIANLANKYQNIDYESARTVKISWP